MKLRYYKSLLEPHLYEFQPCLTIHHFLFVFLFISTPELLRPIDHAPVHIFQVSRVIVTQSHSEARLYNTHSLLYWVLKASVDSLSHVHLIPLAKPTGWKHCKIPSSQGGNTEQPWWQQKRTVFLPSPSKEWNAYTKFSLWWTQERTKISSATL